MQDEEPFLSSLAKPLHPEYKKRKTELLKNIEETFAKDRSQFYENKSRGIKQDKYHKEVLNSCIFPFVQKSALTEKLGYVYLRSSPLSEKGLKNVDFLIVSQAKGIAIFGEAKHSVDDPVAVLKQMKERIQIIKSNVEYIKNFVPSLSTVEYVLGVESMDSIEMMKAILRSETKVILWEVGGLEQQLSLVVPSTSDKNARRAMMHVDEDLNKLLRKFPTSKEFKTFFPESHSVTKLELLAAIDKGRGEFFTYEDLKSIVRQELDNLPEKEIEDQTISIIKLAIDVNFVNCNADGNYKIQSRYKNTTSRYEELKEKWINFTLSGELEYIKNEQLSILQKELLAKLPSLDKFTS